MYKDIKEYLKSNGSSYAEKEISETDIEALRKWIQKRTNMDISSWKSDIDCKSAFLNQTVYFFDTTATKKTFIFAKYIGAESCIIINNQDNKTIDRMDIDIGYTMHNIDTWAKENIDNSADSWTVSKHRVFQHLGRYFQVWHDKTCSKDLVIFYNQLFRKLIVLIGIDPTIMNFCKTYTNFIGGCHE